MPRKGRKPAGHEPITSVVGVGFTATHARAVKAAATSEGVTPSTWCRERLLPHLSEPSKVPARDLSEPDEATHRAPEVVSVEGPAGIWWTVTFDDGSTKTVPAHSEAQAKTKARWARAERVTKEEEGR